MTKEAVLENDYLKQLSLQLGVEPEQVLTALVQNEVSYGIAAMFGAVAVMLFGIFFLRKSFEESYGSGSWESIGFLAGVIIIIALAFAANGFHHYYSPESYAMKDLYRIVVHGHWDPID